MNKLFKRVVVGVMTVAMVFGLAGFSPVSTVKAADDLKGKLVVLHTNDMHGSYEKTEKSLGMSTVGALKRYYQQKGANVLLLDAGDFSQGTNLVNYFKGLDAVHFMNAAGYDAATLGNHEFDFGFDELKAMVATAQFPILDANILDKTTGKPYFGSNKVFEFGSLKVGVFGLDTPEAQTKSNPKNVKDVNFLAGAELYECAKAQVAELKAQGCNYIICISHLGVDEESITNRSVDVAVMVPGIDLMIDGHSHTKIPGGLEAGDALVVSTGNALATVGCVVYDGKTTTAKLITDASFAGDFKAMDDFVASYATIVKEAYAGKFATTLNVLNGKKAPGVRTMETNLGDFSADAYKFTAESYVKDAGLSMKIDGAIQNGGGIRATIEAGDISMDTLYTVFPFGNTISIVSLTGEQLLEALEASCHACPEAVGGFPQVSGIEFTINTAVPYEKGAQYPNSTYFAPANPGSRVTITTVGGKKFDKKAVYNIAVNNFMADGGDTYYVLKNAKNVIDTGVVDAEGLISYVKSLNGVIGNEYASPKGLITIK